LIPLYDTIPSAKKPYVMYSIILANIAVFIYELTLNPIQLKAFMFEYGLVPARYTVGYFRDLLGFSLIPWFTHMFLHGGWGHIIGNMWFLWIFGDNVEDAFGHLKFLAFYITGGLFAAFFHFLTMAKAPIPMVGASGAISAVMGAYFVLFPYSRIVSLVFLFFFFTLVAIPAYFYLLIWFLMQVFNGLADTVRFYGSGVAWWAHAGGFIFGMIVGGRVRKRYYWYM